MVETWKAKCPGCRRGSNSHQTETDAINWIETHQKECDWNSIICGFCDIIIEKGEVAWVDYVSWRIKDNGLQHDWTLEKKYYHEKCYEMRNDHLCSSEKRKLSILEYDRKEEKLNTKKQSETSSSKLLKLKDVVKIKQIDDKSDLEGRIQKVEQMMKEMSEVFNKYQSFTIQEPK